MNSTEHEVLVDTLELFEAALENAIEEQNRSLKLRAQMQSDPTNLLLKNQEQMCIESLKNAIESAESYEKVILEIYEEHSETMPAKYREKIQKYFSHKIISIEARKIAANIANAAPKPPPINIWEDPAPAVKPSPSEIRKQVKEALAARRKEELEAPDEIQKKCPWIPIRMPKKREFDMPPMDARIVKFYDEILITAEWREMFRLLSEFFFYLFFECKVYEWRSFFGPDAAVEFWKSPHSLARAKLEAALSYRCAKAFLMAHEKKPIVTQIDETMVLQFREKAYEQLQYEEQTLAGRDSIRGQREDLNRHFTQIEKFWEDRQKQYEEAETTKTKSVPNLISAECRQANVELLNKLKEKQMEITDCNDLVNMHENLRKHNSRKTVEKILHRDLISDLKRVISDYENSKLSTN